MKDIFINFNNSRYSIYDRPLPTADDEIKALTKQFSVSALFFAVFLLNKIIGYVRFHEDGEKYDMGYCFHSSY